MGRWVADNVVALLALAVSGWALWGQYYRRKLTVQTNQMSTGYSSSFGETRQEHLVVVTVTNHGRPLTINAPYAETTPKPLPLGTAWLQTSAFGIPNVLEVSGAMQFEAGPQGRRLQEGETAQWALRIAGSQGTTGVQQVVVVVRVTGGRTFRTKPFAHDVTPPANA